MKKKKKKIVQKASLLQVMPVGIKRVSTRRNCQPRLQHYALSGHFSIGGYLRKCLALTYLGKARIVLLHIRFISTSSTATNSIAIMQLVNLFSFIVCKLCSWPEQAVQLCKGVPPWILMFRPWLLVSVFMRAGMFRCAQVGHVYVCVHVCVSVCVDKFYIFLDVIYARKFRAQCVYFFLMRHRVQAGAHY